MSLIYLPTPGGYKPVSLSNPLPVDASRLVPNSTQPDQRLTVDATVGGVQLAPLDAATTHVFWTSEAAECRVTFDGSAPTAANGHLIAPGSSGTWTAAMAAATKWIRTGATSAVIHVSQMRAGQ